MREFRHLLAISIVFVFIGCSGKSTSDDRFVTLKIYHTNDIHSRLLPDGKHRGGLAYLASVLRVIREQEPEALILDAGDFYKRGAMPAQKSHDEVTADLLSLMPYYDARALGNNEIKVGIPQIVEWSKSKEPAPLLAANFVDKTGQPVFAPYKIIKKAGLTVGLIGLTEKWTIDSDFQPDSKKDSKAPYKILDTTTTAGSLIAQLRPQVDVLIIVSHQTYKKNLELAKKFPQVDLVISGHTHILTPDQKKIGENMVVEAGEFGHQLGVATVIYDKNLKKVNSLESTFWPIGVDMQLPEPKIQEAIQKAYKKWAPEAFEVLAHSESEMTVINNNSRYEGSLGNYVVDLITTKTKSDVGFINGAFTREAFQPGKVTRDALYMSVPFEDTIMTAKISRTKLHEMIQEAVETQYKNIGFVPFAFSNAKLQLKMDALRKNLLAARVSILPEKEILKIALTSYVANHCTEFFKEKYCPLQVTPTGIEVRKLFEETLLARKRIEAPMLNRVSVTDK
jgi:2',3'-cyclic-nucleotide 2'-phosphodiesterase (5'-nucleotidase family)